MKQLTRGILAAVILGGMFLAPRTSAQNLFTNPGFETGVVTPWSASSAPGFNPGNWAVSPLNPHSGLGAAHNFFDGGLFQTASGITGGQTYSFSGWAFLQSGGDLNPDGSANGWGSFVQLAWLNAGGSQIGGLALNFDVDNQPRDQWNLYAQNILAPATATQARLLIGTFTSNINPLDPSQGVHAVAESDWDDFSLTLIPEPGTYALLAVGLGIMIPVIRRRLK